MLKKQNISDQNVMFDFGPPRFSITYAINSSIPNPHHIGNVNGLWSSHHICDAIPAINALI